MAFAPVRLGDPEGVECLTSAPIRNALMGCVHALRTDSTTLTVDDVHIAHKISRGSNLPDEVLGAISCVTDNDDAAIHSADVVGGTAWLFSRDELEGAFDYLFVDEAGQVSLANLVAMVQRGRQPRPDRGSPPTSASPTGCASPSSESVLSRLDSGRGPERRTGARHFLARNMENAPRSLHIYLVLSSTKIDWRAIHRPRFSLSRLGNCPAAVLGGFRLLMKAAHKFVPRK